MSDITSTVDDVWTNLVGAVLQQAVEDLASGRDCVEGDASHNLCRDGVHSCCGDAREFLCSDWGAHLVDITNMNYNTFMYFAIRAKKKVRRGGNDRLALSKSSGRRFKVRRITCSRRHLAT